MVAKKECEFQYNAVERVVDLFNLKQHNWYLLHYLICFPEVEEFLQWIFNKLLEIQSDRFEQLIRLFFQPSSAGVLPNILSLLFLDKIRRRGNGGRIFNRIKDFVKTNCVKSHPNWIIINEFFDAFCHPFPTGAGELSGSTLLTALLVQPSEALLDLLLELLEIANICDVERKLHIVDSLVNSRVPKSIIAQKEDGRAYGMQYLFENLTKEQLKKFLTLWTQEPETPSFFYLLCKVDKLTWTPPGELLERIEWLAAAYNADEQLKFLLSKQLASSHSNDGIKTWMWLCRNDATCERLESLIKTLNGWDIPLILLINFELIRTWENETNFLAYLCSSEEGRTLLYSQHLTEGRPIIDGLLSFALEPIETFPAFVPAIKYLKKTGDFGLPRWMELCASEDALRFFSFFFTQSSDPRETQKLRKEMANELFSSDCVFRLCMSYAGQTLLFNAKSGLLNRVARELENQNKLTTCLLTPVPENPEEFLLEHLNEKSIKWIICFKNILSNLLKDRVGRRILLESKNNLFKRYWNAFSEVEKEIIRVVIKEVRSEEIKKDPMLRPQRLSLFSNPSDSEESDTDNAHQPSSRLQRR
ncbi:hypothetical protein [Coxiella burnetii]|uniref:hypothetical protein n=1 Tax=Coxiella burnetii TaxID=777 RepID=UPI001ED945E2|nr:hypothetical protein [Coxiella burnetii]